MITLLEGPQKPTSFFDSPVDRFFLDIFGSMFCVFLLLLLCYYVDSSFEPQFGPQDFSGADPLRLLRNLGFFWRCTSALFTLAASWQGRMPFFFGTGMWFWNVGSTVSIRKW